MGRKFWTGRYAIRIDAIRIDANRPGVYRWLITLEARSVRKGSPPTVTRLPPRSATPWDELPPHQKS